MRIELKESFKEIDDFWGCLREYLIYLILVSVLTDKVQISVLLFTRQEGPVHVGGRSKGSTNYFKLIFGRQINFTVFAAVLCALIFRRERVARVALEKDAIFCN